MGEQSLLDAQLDCEGVGWQTDLVQVNPSAHGSVALHAARHCPSAQRSFAAHWLEYTQTEETGWHAPATHASPSPQSDVLRQAQGPCVPPHDGIFGASAFASGFAPVFASAFGRAVSSTRASPAIREKLNEGSHRDNLLRRHP